MNYTHNSRILYTNEGINLSSNSARVDLVDNAGDVIPSSKVTSGTSILDVGKYHFPIAANIKVYDSANMLIAETPYMKKIRWRRILASLV